MAQSRSALQKAFNAVLAATDDKGRRASAESLTSALQAYLASDEGSAEPPDFAKPLVQTQRAFADRPTPLSRMDEGELSDLNSLLPWAAMTVDERGRLLGRPWSAVKRASVHSVVEKRLAAFNAEYPVAGRHVAEFGCFEGIYTLAMRLLGAEVTAIDGRVENVIKTLTRLWAYGETARVLLWNVEEAPPPTLPPTWDVLHHFGVLYHLTDPVGHLQTILPRTGEALLLDTHVADNLAQAERSYQVAGRTYAYRNKPEPNAAVAPFAGMRDHAKYLVLEDLVSVIQENGFSDVRVVSDREERNGRRVTIWGFRQPR